MKTILFVLAPFAAAVSVGAIAHFVVTRRKDPLAIRLKDRAIFERSSAPCRENPPLFVRLVWVQRSWWPGGKLVPNGETWSCNDDSQYDVVAREYVEAGARELFERSKR